MPVCEAPDGTTKRDLRLEGRAAKERWALTPEDRDRLKERQLRLALDPDVPERIANQATRNVLAMDGLNIEAERLELDRAKFEASKANDQSAPFVVPDVEEVG